MAARDTVAGVRPFHRVIVRSMVAGVAEALARPSIDAGLFSSKRSDRP